MRKVLVPLLLGAFSVLAQPPKTSVVDTIYNQMGNLYNGQIVVQLSVKSGTAGGTPIVSTVVTKQITNGALSLLLVPNTSLTPSGSTYIINWANGGQRTCTIPVSVTPISMGPYCTDNPPPIPSPSIPLSWLNPVGGTVGQAMCLLTSGWGPGSCGGGGSGGLSWSGITASQWAAIGQ